MPGKILIVDDLAANRRILSGMLRGEYGILETSGGEEALEILGREGESICAVLLDIGMPGMDGFEALRRIRANAHTAHMPVIMITASADADSRVKALALGANDFVVKPYSAEIIRHCLRNNIALQESSERVMALQRDRLTGLLGRDAFFDAVREKVSASAPGHYVMACFDIERFKVINDQYGTRKGDDVLRHVAAVFARGFEPVGGVCCRSFADNFAVLYPASFQNSEGIRAIREEACHVEGLVAPLAFSVGRYVADDVSMPPAAMYDRAMIAAGSAKGRYESHIAYYDETMRERLLREQQIVMEMEEALAGRQFEVWLQPQFNHSTGAMVGAEALVRWRHPQRGLIPPGEFIPVFERNGFIYSLDRFVWEEVSRTLRGWLDGDASPLPVSVNVSRYDLLRPDVVEAIEGLAEKYGLPMGLLRLEITESAFSEAPERIVGVVRRLVARGFTVEIDDFGSGYSSLNTLKDVPAQTLKLDMKFLDGSGDTSRGGNIVESIVRMAKWLGMSVIAEGVETLGQADYLRSIGLSYMQGYLFARPMPVAELEAFGSGRAFEERRMALETVDNMDNDAFWDPASMDTLIFNSYVGAASICEYQNGAIEMLRATQKFPQIFGDGRMTVEDVLRLDWAAHLDGENRARLREALDESARTRKEVVCEFVFRGLPGCPEETYLRSGLRVIATAGERRLVYCINDNITAQREAERRERRAAEQARAILREAGGGITAAVLDGAGKIDLLFSNDKFFEIHGYTRAQYEAEVDDKFACVYEADREKARADTIRAYTTQTPAQLEYRLVTRDGAVRWVRVNLSSARFTGIDQNVHLCIFDDITEGKRQQQELRDASAQLRGMMDDMPGGFVRMRVFPDGGVRPAYFNDGMLKLCDMSRERLMEIYGRDALAGVHPDDAETVREIIRGLLKNGEAHSSRYRLRHGSRGYIWLSTFERASRDASGDTYLNIYYTDATEKVREEEAQKALLDNLPGGAGLYEYRDGALTALYLNKSYWRLVGREERDRAQGAPISSVHADDMPVLMREVASAAERGRDPGCEIRLRHGSEGYLPVRIAGRIVPRDGGGYFVYVTFSPISEGEMSYQQMLPLLLSAMMDSTTDLSFAKDKAFRYIAASRAFAEMAGLSGEADVIGKTDYDLFDREQADKYRRDDEALLASGAPIVDMTERIPSADGAPRYSSTSKYPLRDGSGAVIGLYGVGRDVTKSVARDSQLRLVNDSIPGGLATYVCTPGDFDARHVRLTYFNDGFLALFGYAREEYEALAARDPAGLMAEEDRPPFVEQWRALMKDGAPMDCVFRVRAKDGGARWINLKAVAADRRSDLAVVNAILQDVTDQRELIERLRISEEESNLALRLGGNVVCRYSLADGVLSLSPEAAAAYSLPERICGVPYEPVRLGLIAPESADAYIGFFEAICGGERASTVTFQQKYSGQWRWMEARGATIFESSGKPARAIVSFADVTEKLKKETIYKKWQQSMEERPPESYTLFRCSLHGDATFEAREGERIDFDFDSAGASFNERARAYANARVFAEDREKYIALVNSGAMLAGFSRGKRSAALEYREADGGRWLRLSIELVEQYRSNDVEAYLLYEDIDEIKKGELQTQRLAETDPLTGLMNRGAFAERFGKLAGARKRGALSALFILDLDGFKNVNDSFGHATGDATLIEMGQKLRGSFRGQDLVCRLGGDEFMVYMHDVSHLSAVREKAALVCALLHKSFSLEVQLSASVGISVFPDDGEDFETLYRKADLALYHVKGMGKDGYALYEQGMEEGKRSPEAEAAEIEAEVSAFAAPKRRMLIVEDNELNRDFLTALFEDDFIIDTAAEGTAALVRLRRYGSGISVVLLDLMMPGLDGFAVLQKMRESVAMQSVPVVVVSGRNERETCLEAIRNGASDYVTKPVDADLLKVRVASAISKAENEQLRAQNRYLAIQNEEARRLAEAKRHSEELSLALHAAERADLAKSQFLSSMSHEIRTPLNAVIGYNTIARSELSEAKTDEERRQAEMKVLDCLTKSEVASRHLLTIINDVLDMSAIESGKMKVDDSPFDFRGLITSLTVMFFSQARAKGVNFEVLFDRPTEEWFVGDQLRVNQILTNLLSNAVKFTPEGGNVTLTITERAATDTTAGFRFVVSDTGIGMTQEYLQHLWTPFEQAEASISRRFGGTGLGLSITKSLVDLMKGAIYVKSESGAGSQFTVDLTFQRTEQPKKPVSFDFSDVNALVVDDDVSTCDYIKLLFDRCGANCMALTSGRRAVDAFAAAKERGKPFNMCLVDWRMPDMDGLATISAIRRIAAKETPIVVVTAYDFAEVADQTERLGINRFISKPLFQSSLYDLLANVSGKQTVAPEEKNPRHDFDGARVLLVEDNNMNMEVAKRILLAAKCAVDSAWNGQEAFDIFTASRPGTYSAILMDVHMPIVDGYQATRMIRASAHPDAVSTPIIAMTADVFAEDVAEARSAGMNDHIAKPIDVESLFQMLEEYMGGERK